MGFFKRKFILDIAEELGSITCMSPWLQTLYMCVVMVTDSYTGGKGANDLSISMEAVEALGLLIAGSVDQKRYVIYMQGAK